MSDLKKYLAKRGVTEAEMDAARRYTQECIDAYNLREARKACRMTQMEMAKVMGVSQNRVSRMENGNIGVMSLDSIRRYIEAVGGRLELIADLPTGRVRLAE